MQSLKYDIIFVYESYFQKGIIEYLIENKVFDVKNILIIDAMGDKIKMLDKTWNINIGGIKKTLSSIAEIRKYNCNLETTKLVGVMMAGLNSRFFEMMINYKELIIIDDGIGTPVLLRHPERWRLSAKYLKAFFFNFIIFLFLKGKTFKTTKQLLRKINMYYSIYDIPVPESFIKKKINYFDQYNMTLIPSKLGIIGQPWGLNKLAIRDSMIDCIYNTFPDYHICYYAHPREHYTDTIDKTKVSDIILPNTTVENYFSDNGIPEIIIAHCSSVLLNLNSMKINNLKLYFIIETRNKTYYNFYYDLLEEIGIRSLN